MSQQYTHLRETLIEFGDADGTEEVNELISMGLALQRARRDQERIDAGKELRTNPFVTDSGKECDRQIVMALANCEETDPLDDDSLVNFAVGSAVEEAFCKMLEPLGGRLLRELRVELPTGNTVVTGRADLLVFFEERRWLVELKSTSSKNMTWLLRRRAASPSHVKQLNLYVHASHQGLLIDPATEQPFEPFADAFVSYIVKDATKGEPPRHSFRVAYNRSMAVGDLLRLDNLYTASTGPIIPPKPAGYSSWKFPCGWCSYKTHCWPSPRSKGR